MVLGHCFAKATAALCRRVAPCPLPWLPPLPAPGDPLPWDALPLQAEVKGSDPDLLLPVPTSQRSYHWGMLLAHWLTPSLAAGTMVEIFLGYSGLSKELGARIPQQQRSLECRSQRDPVQCRGCPQPPVLGSQGRRLLGLTSCQLTLTSSKVQLRAQQRWGPDPQRFGGNIPHAGTVHGQEDALGQP